MEQYLNEQTAPLLAGVFCFVIGAVLVFMRRKRAARCTAQTAGVVSAVIRDVSKSIDHDELKEMREEQERGAIVFTTDKTRGTKTSVTYRPQFTYSVNGREYVNVSDTGTARRRFKEGQAVTVLYDPADPNVYVVKEDKAAGMLGWIFLLAGVALVVFSFFVDYFPLTN